MCSFKALYVTNTYVFSYLNESGTLMLGTFWKWLSLGTCKYGNMGEDGKSNFVLSDWYVVRCKCFIKGRAHWRQNLPLSLRNEEHLVWKLSRYIVLYAMNLIQGETHLLTLCSVYVFSNNLLIFSLPWSASSICFFTIAYNFSVVLMSCNTSLSSM